MNAIRGLGNHWFDFYISGRKQYTSIYGVTKGSVSGRHLFGTYISDLLRALKYSKVHHVADDAGLNFSPIKLINKQVNDNFKVISLAYIANGWNGNENLVTERSISFELQNV